ncbi:MAG: pantetheine-phosphate adenylyltransferase [Christensenellaceae bacterium]|jgi:pantetheine-phosphate adenylyltransferase|nr:pantetheine-phosphate adenylyltransferase [Christensenellaceae bacterium]
MAACLFPGSFDPLTNGHLDLIARLAALYDEVVVCVMQNPAKRSLFSIEERLTLIRQACEGLVPNARAVSHAGFTVEAAKKEGCAVMARGLRGAADYEYETQLALVNRHLAPKIETLFLPADPKLSAVSSSFIREIHALGGDVSALVPACVLRALQAPKA